MILSSSKIATLLQQPTLSAGLYLIATPLGNLADITIRAIATLHAVDGILCEDTRHSQKLLRAYDIHKPLQAYHDFSTEEVRAKIIAQLKAGQKLALISDAGVPLIADPGYKLVRDCITNNIIVQAITGGTAAINAMVLSGFPSDQFCFMGFFPVKKNARQQILKEHARSTMPLIFYESPNRLLATLEDIALLLPQRRLCVARELTKIYEEIQRGTAAEIAAYYQQKNVKGEIVLIIEGTTEQPPSQQEVVALLQRALQSGVSVKQASADIAAATGISRKEIYAMALTLKT